MQPIRAEGAIHTDSGDSLLEKPAYFGLDFAPLLILSHVKGHVITPLVDIWCKQVETEKLARMNLAAAMLSTHQSSHLDLNQEELDILRSVYRDASYSPHFADLLRSHSHHLFNAYFYLISEVFGERVLIPVLPGVPRTVADNEFDLGIDKLVDKLELPYRVNEEYINTYEAQLLPLHAGLTPYSCLLFEQGHRISDSGQRDAYYVSNVSMFLGDLALLHKREDYAHKHLSALVSVLSPEKQEVSGALVLSCVMPSAFPSCCPSNFQNAIDGIWSQRLADRLSVDLRHADRASHTCVQLFRSHSGVAPYHAARSELSDCLIDLVKGDKSKKMLAICTSTVDRENTSLVASAVNIEAITNAIHALLPTGPWLSSSLVAECDSNDGIPVVDPEKVRRVAKGLHFTSVESEPQNTSKGSYIEDAVKIYCDMRDDLSISATHAASMSRHCSVDTLRIGPHKGHIVHVYRGRSDHRTRDSTVELQRALTQTIELCVCRSGLPGSSNRVLAGLQQHWNRHRLSPNSHEQRHDAQPPGREVDSVTRELDAAITTLRKTSGPFPSPLVATTSAILFQGIDLLFQANSDLSTLLVGRNKTVFAPRFDERNATGSDAIRKLFREAYCAYPSFWLFENVNHYLLRNHVSLEDFDELPEAWRYWTRKAEVLRDRESPAVQVVLSDDDIRNSRWIKALTYFGVPVHTWKGHGIQSPQSKDNCDEADCDLVFCTSSDDIAGAYNKYLRTLLAVGMRVPAVERLFIEYDKSFKIMAINVTQESNSVIHEVALMTPAGTTLHETIEWEPLSTMEIAFSAIDGPRLAMDIGKDFADKIVTGHDTDSSSFGLSREAGWSELDERESVKVTQEMAMLVNEQRDNEEKARQDVLNAVTHEILNSLPRIRDMLNLQKHGESKFLTSEQAISGAEDALEFINFNLAAFGDPQRSESADLLPDPNCSAVDGWEKLATLGIKQGARLAGHRLRLDDQRIDEEEWITFLHKVIKRFSSIRVRGKRFCQPIRGRSLGRRIGSQLTLLGAVANTVQHVIRHFSDGQAGGVLSPPSTVTEVIQIHLLESSLRIINQGVASTPVEGSAYFGRAGSMATLRDSVTRPDFGWSTPGTVDLTEVELTKQTSVYELNIVFPHPFWQEAM